MEPLGNALNNGIAKRFLNVSVGGNRIGIARARHSVGGSNYHLQFAPK